MKLVTVKRIYNELNALNFGGVLEMPRILFSRSDSFHGQHWGTTLEFSLADVRGIPAVTELIYHEMVHEYVDDFLNINEKEHHGKVFKKTYNKFAFGVVKDKNYE